MDELEKIRNGLSDVKTVENTNITTRVNEYWNYQEEQIEPLVPMVRLVNK